MPGDLAGQQVASRHPSEQDLDGATGLLFDHTAQHHGSVGADREEQHHRHHECSGLVVGAATLDLAELDVGDPNGFDDGEQIVGVQPGCFGSVAGRRRAGWHRSQRP